MSQAQAASSYTSDFWREYRASGRRHVVWVGMFGGEQKPAVIRAVSKGAVRVVFDGRTVPEPVHPADLRPAQ